MGKGARNATSATLLPRGRLRLPLAARGRSAERIGTARKEVLSRIRTGGRVSTKTTSTSHWAMSMRLALHNFSSDCLTRKEALTLQAGQRTGRRNTRRRDRSPARSQRAFVYATNATVHFSTLFRSCRFQVWSRRSGRWEGAEPPMGSRRRDTFRTFTRLPLLCSMCHKRRRRGTTFNRRHSMSLPRSCQGSRRTAIGRGRRYFAHATKGFCGLSLRVRHYWRGP